MAKISFVRTAVLYCNSNWILQSYIYIYKVTLEICIVNSNVPVYSPQTAEYKTR